MSFNKRSYAYLAGMIDGDGGIYICKSKVNGCDTYQSQLCVANCNRKLMNWLRHHFGGCLHKNSSAGDVPNFGSAVKKIYTNKVDNWQWRLTGNKTIQRTLDEIKSYLSINQERAEAAYNLVALHGKYRASEERQLCFNQMEKAGRHNTPNQEYTPAYFSGFFDAEGSISLVAAKTSQAFRPLIRLSSNDIEILEWFKESLGFGEIYSTLQDGTARYTWYFKTTDEKKLENFLLTILPYLIVKREQIKICLNLIRTPVSERTMERCTLDRNRIMELNSYCSVTTNMPTSPENGLKIESDLIGDYESEPVVTLAS